MNQLYKKKHELWLEIAFASFASTDEEMKSRLYEFSLIAFRHMKWLSVEILSAHMQFDYDRDKELSQGSKLFELLLDLQENIQALKPLYPFTPLGERLKNDDNYLLEYLKGILADESKNATLTAFNMQREWSHKNLSVEEMDALTLFLFEESYKEYELILVYNYMQAHTQNALHYNVFQDLIDESHFHFKSFGQMMAKLGILTLPRELHPMSYIVKDLVGFVRDGIAEEEAAKEMCRELSAKIKDEELSKFFDFINAQESYHIELMKKLL
jgi:rubrerythrin